MKQNTLLAFVGGVLVGTAACILFAPGRAASMRRKIRAHAAEHYAAMREHVCNCNCGEEHEVEEHEATAAAGATEAAAK